MTSGRSRARRAAPARSRCRWASCSPERDDGHASPGDLEPFERSWACVCFPSGQAFEGDECCSHLPVLSLELQHVVHGLPPADDAPRPIVDDDFRRQRPPIVGRRHDRSVRPGVHDGQEITTSSGGISRPAPSVSLVSQSGPTMSHATVGPSRRTTARWRGRRRRARAQEFGHAGIEHREMAIRPAGLEVDTVATSAPAGPTIARPGSMSTSGRSHRAAADGRGVLLRCRAAVPSYEIPMPPPRSTCSSGRHPRPDRGRAPHQRDGSRSGSSDSI